MIRSSGAIAAFLFSMVGASAEPTNLPRKIGDTYEITLTRDSANHGSDASSATTHDQDALTERLVAVRNDGLDVVYDLPPEATAEERAQTWQFPARIFQPYRGPLQLLNRSELETRVDAWLKAANWPRTVCGHWIFTWNAFRIDCDPQTVLETVQAFDLRVPDLRDGAPYRDAHALGPAPIIRKAAGPAGATFTVEMVIDPDAVRRERAESDVVVGEISRKPLALEAALRAHAKEAVSGTISVTLDTDAAGNVRRRTKVTKVEIRKTDGSVETEIATETLERRLLAPAKS